MLLPVLDPQQELFCEIKKSIVNLGYDVYDGFLPPENTPYPFVYLGEFIQTDNAANKTAVFGTVAATIHLWLNDPHQRGKLSAMMFAIKRACYALESTTHFRWMITGTNQRILPDSSTNVPLLHGVVEVDFKFN